MLWAPNKIYEKLRAELSPEHPKYGFPFPDRGRGQVSRE
jgi:hypothetical protein